ncbi:somatostatin receptor type 3-like [Antedon mediterranea]|uniref:somatostatin receptor type 3-like n=1 Tax=Antedon mediterranea TaxID=105859 RepID=UPI003AF641B8
MYKKSLLHGLIFQQSVVDLFGCCMFLFFYNQDAPDGTGGRVFCKGRALYWFLAFTSTYNLVIITFERYIAVVHPITYRNRNIGRRSNVFYMIPYIIGFLLTFHFVIISDVNKELKGECMYVPSLLSGTLMFILIYFFPASFMIFCYCRILFRIRKRSREKKHNAPDFRKRRPQVAVKTNLVLTMLIVVAAFIITISPNTIMYLIYNICRCFDFSNIIGHEITVLISTCNMCVNPIIYGAKMEDFKNGVREIWRRMRDTAVDTSYTPTNVMTLSCSPRS